MTPAVTATSAALKLTLAALVAVLALVALRTGGLLRRGGHDDTDRRP